MLHQLVQKGMIRVRRSRRKLATAAAGALVCFLGYHVVFGPNGVVVYQQKRREYHQLQQQIQSLQQQNETLSQQIKSLQTDRQAIEKVAREQLRYVRPGEVVYTLPVTPVP